MSDAPSKSKGTEEKSETTTTTEKKVRKFGGSSGVSRPMKYPYTFTAKLVQFPWKFYFVKNWLYKYYLIAIIASLPLFYKLGKLSNSSGNREKWAESLRKDEEEYQEKWE